jgi:hypothetical protein
MSATARGDGNSILKWTGLGQLVKHPYYAPSKILS